MIGTISQNKAKVVELETQLEEKDRQVQILVGDFAVMDQHYKSIYDKFRTALTKLEGRKEEIEELSLEIAQMEDNYNAASQALSVSYDSSVFKLQIYGNGLYDRNGLLFSKIDEVFTQDFRDRVNQELDSFKNVATEHKNEFGKAIHSTLSTIIKQVNDGASYSSDMSQLFDNTTQKMENFVEKEFVQIQSSGKTPKRKLLGSELNENLVYIPPPKKLFEEQKGLITPKKNVNYKRRDSFLDSSFVSSLVSSDTLK
ncbi:unnamed protein product [Meloidogyne enterolobii]|uniref:Uncharacterized protein n=1 Tax=Meloidogyne enterolobii TaxID=390850 RepID=A0ACB0ZVW3_MELEN